MRAIAFAMVLVGVFSCSPIDKVPSAAGNNEYYSRIVSGFTTWYDGDPDPYIPRGYHRRSIFAIWIKFEEVDKSILLDDKATQKLLDQALLWVGEQFAKQGKPTPLLLTIVRVKDSQENVSLVALRERHDERWQLFRSGDLFIEK
ncbi:hypothetical protein ACVIGB_000340 [Bradyrhizobium sp. USDA 4341]